MNISPRGLEFIRRMEACRLEAYQDSVGIWTIGYGHIRGPVREGDTCTQEQAEAWLLEDVASIAERCIQNMVKVDLTQQEYDALCSFIFNLGCSAFRNSTLLRKLNDGDFDGAAEQFAKWNHADNKVILGLTHRRQAERELFESVA